MDFETKFPTWAEGTEPSDSIKKTGFQPGYKPPAAFFNWFWNLMLNGGTELQEALSFLEEDLRGLSNIFLETESMFNLRITRLEEKPTGAEQHASTHKTDGSDPIKPGDIGAIASAAEILSTTSITDAALAQTNGTVKNYAFSGDSYAGGDLPSDGYKYGSATVFKRYGFAAVVLWGAPNADAIAIKYYNSTASSWTDWAVMANNKLSNVDLTKVRVGGASWADYANYPGMHDCSNKDFNTLRTSGLYFGYTGMTNAAFQEISVLEVIQYSGDWVLQRHTRLSDGRMYYRIFISGTTWSAWEVINTSKHPGYSSGTSDLTAGSSPLPTNQLHFVYE